MNVKEYVLTVFAEPQKCYGHCDSLARARTVKEDPFTVCYACEGGYASRLIAYGQNAGASGLKDLVDRAFGGSYTAKDEDFRVASRYTWDLGLSPSVSPKQFGAVYWTQNYGRSKSSDPERPTLFCCRTCSSLFQQPYSAKQTQCEKCRPAG